jgi:hypothetical protein
MKVGGPCFGLQLIVAILLFLGHILLPNSISELLFKRRRS